MNAPTLYGTALEQHFSDSRWKIFSIESSKIQLKEHADSSRAMLAFESLWLLFKEKWRHGLSRSRYDGFLLCWTDAYILRAGWNAFDFTVLH